MMGMTPEDWGRIGGIAGILGTLIALVGVPFLALAWRNHLIDEMTKNPMARERLGQALQAATPVTLYRRSLERGLDKLDGWMGGFGQFGRGYGWCFAVAMGYATAFVFLPWLLHGHGTGFGNLVLLPDADASRPSWIRAGAMLALVSWLSIAGLALRNRKQIDGLSRATLARLLGRGTTERLVKGLLAAITFVLALAFVLLGFWVTGREFTTTRLAVAFAGAVSVAGAVAGTGAVAVAGAFAFAAAIAVAVAVAGAFAGVVLALALSLLGLISPELGLSIGLFLAVLPLLNALLDWSSWLLSRWLGRDLLSKLNGGRVRQFWALLWHSAVDVAGAALFLVLLAYVLPHAVALFLDSAGALVGGVEAPLGTYLCTAAQDPLGAGLWASGMLFSTLLPTALHLMFLVASPLAFWLLPSAPVWQERAAYLTGDRAAPPDADLPGSPTLQPAQSAEPGVWRETLRRVAWWRIRQTAMIYPAALVVAVVALFLIWEGVQWLAGPLPAWLLWVATGDWGFVGECLPALPRPQLLAV